MDRGAWWATVHGVPKEADMTEHACTHTHTHTHSLIWLSRLFLHIQLHPSTIMCSSQLPEYSLLCSSLDLLHILVT